MRKLRLLTLALALSCAVPSGWTLCVGPGGHLVIEPSVPSGALCCTPGEAVAEDSCAPEGCGDCRDMDIASSVSLRTRADVDATISAPVETPQGVEYTAALIATLTPAIASTHLSTPPLQTVSLRC